MMLSRTVVLLVVSTALLRPVDVRADTVGASRIRPTAPYLAELIREGMASSATFRALAVRVMQSDLVVYIMPGELRSHLRGQLTFMGAAGNTRYLRIDVDWQLPDARAIAALGHELQHAVEVADAPGVRDKASLAREFARIGHPSTAMQFGEYSYDTQAAVDAGDRIRVELATAAD